MDINQITFEKDLFRAKAILGFTIIAAFAYYYVMEDTYPGHKDALWLRSILCATGLIGFLVISVRKYSHLMYVFVDLAYALYAILYLYLMVINDWSVFHRWCYFGVGGIGICFTFNWNHFLRWGTIIVLAPVVVSLFDRTLNFNSYLHFHMSMFFLMAGIGVTIWNGHFHEQKLLRVTELAVTQSKMADLGSIAGGVAHEINNPLMMILGKIDLLLMKRSRGKSIAPEDYDSTLALVQESSLRMSQIVRGLMNFGLEGEGKAPQVIPVKDLLTSVMDLCGERFRNKGILIYQTGSLEGLQVQVVPSEIVHILMNLMNNAFDAVRDLPQPQVWINVSVQETNLEIRVRDNGTGVPEAIEKKIFTPFFTTKPIGSGTGMGLNIAFGLAKSNQGLLWLDTQVSRSCFALRLPLSYQGLKQAA